MLLDECLFVFEAPAWEKVKAAILFVDSAFHQLQPNAAEEEDEKLSTGDDYEDQDWILGSLQSDELIILTCEVDQTKVDNANLNNQRASFKLIEALVIEWLSSYLDCEEKDE